MFAVACRCAFQVGPWGSPLEVIRYVYTCADLAGCCCTALQIYWGQEDQLFMVFFHVEADRLLEYVMYEYPVGYM